MSDIYISKFGAVQEFADAAARTSAAIAASRPKHEALDLTRLPALEAQRLTLTERIADRQGNIALLEPEVARLARELKDAMAAYLQAEAQLKDAHKYARRDALAPLKTAVDKLTMEHAELKDRLDRNTGVLAATKKLLADWHERNDAELQALRELDRAVDPRGGNFHTHRLGSRGPQDLSLAK